MVVIITFKVTLRNSAAETKHTDGSEWQKQRQREDRNEVQEVGDAIYRAAWPRVLLRFGNEHLHAVRQSIT
jgi:hypothetical protein